MKLNDNVVSQLPKINLKKFDNVRNNYGSAPTFFQTSQQMRTAQKTKQSKQNVLEKNDQQSKHRNKGQRSFSLLDQSQLKLKYQTKQIQLLFQIFKFPQIIIKGFFDSKKQLRLQFGFKRQIFSLKQGRITQSRCKIHFVKDIKIKNIKIIAKNKNYNKYKILKLVSQEKQTERYINNPKLESFQAQEVSKLIFLQVQKQQQCFIKIDQKLIDSMKSYFFKNTKK